MRDLIVWRPPGFYLYGEKCPLTRLTAWELTALGEAAKNGFYDVVKVVLEHDPDVNAQDWAGRTPLYFAARRGHHGVVELLLSGDGVLVDTSDASPLQVAASEGHASVVKLLLDLGKADVNSRTDDGETALLCAAQEGHEEVTELLLRCTGIETDVVDKWSKTPLFYAIEEGHVGVSDMIRQHQATTNGTAGM